MNRFAAAALLLVAASAAQAQTVRNVCVEVSCTVETGPTRLVFTWPADATSTAYTVYRRLAGAASWGASVASLGAGATTYTDSTVVVGTAYEYRFDKSGSPPGWGFIRAGIQVPAVHARGKVVLVVCDTHAAYLAAELARLEQDLVGDGWQVLRHDVAAAATVPQVKALIVADYNADPSNVKAVLLVGHVAVPYSGNTEWDGHADHQGAWPCDGYYGEMNGTWTDSSVNNTSPSRPENDNVPGDGKFDQSDYPSAVELAVGRVDLANLPAFAAAERDLLKAYLDKHHQFRHREFSCQERAVVDDNFGYFSGEAFAASAWRNFAPMFGAANSTAADYFTTLNTAPGPGYLWSYGCGGGTYTSAGGVGTTANFAASTNRNVFTLLFGSYHGDWDSADNFLRAPLGSGWTLTNAWSGRPIWSFWQMALGATIGDCAKYSMGDNNVWTNTGTGCQQGLMGDPTLRLHTVVPASTPAAVATASDVTVSWTASTDPVLGYHVYRAADPAGPYTLLNAVPEAGTSYVDSAPVTGTNHYLVRPAILQVSGSGSYVNLGQGVFTSADFPAASGGPSGGGGGGGGGGGCSSGGSASPAPWILAGLALLALAKRR